MIVCVHCGAEVFWSLPQPSDECHTCGRPIAQGEVVWEPGWHLREDSAAPYWEIRGRECYVTVEPRPRYCDRGNWIAKVSASGELARSMDWADGWPRYYFDLDRGKAEVEAWIEKRGQAVAA